MAEQNRTTLDGYLETGDTPTQSQFRDLIDSFINKTDDGTLVDTNPFTGSRVHVVSAVMRYYSSIGGWDLLENQEANPHYTINASSVSSTSSSITLNFDNANWGAGTDADIEVGTSIVVPDETLASEGIMCGASTNFESATIELYKGPRSDYIEYDGASWTTAQGNFSTPSWSTDHLAIPRASSGAFRPTYPQITPRETSYQITLGSVGQDGGDIEVWFYDAAGNAVSTPNTNMKFFINDPIRQVKMDPNSDFDDSYGNLWYIGVFTSGHT